jgi:hypothetical protein
MNPMKKEREFTHSHKCPNPECGCIWSHTSKAHGRTEYHKCPECGKEQWELYEGDDEPAVVQEVTPRVKRWWKSTT